MAYLRLSAQRLRLASEERQGDNEFGMGRRISLLRTAIITLLFTTLFPLHAAHAAKQPTHATEVNRQAASAAVIATWRMPPMSYPQQNPYGAKKEEIGRQLFFDPRLSGDPSRTCAACHHPGLGWADGMARAFGSQQGLGRHTPSLINVGYLKAFFWDGRASTLEDAVGQELLSPGMASAETEGSIVKRISSLAVYRKEFADVFGSEGITFERIVDALATFLRSIRSSSTPFDRWLQGDVKAMSPSAIRGFDLFTGKAQCVRCHIPPIFTDSSFHNTGLNTIDPGHYEISGKEIHRNAFKTPGLRDAALTPPYMHNGSKHTLAEVIDFYDRGGDALDGGNELHPLHLSVTEKADLLAFLRSLSGTPPETLIPVLPLALAP
jgi:cytochrome c peroxidase